MRPTTCVLLALAGTLQPSAQTQAPNVKTTTTGVVMDVSALDKKGVPVVDLRPEEFELSEDGVPQQIASVTLVRGGTAHALRRASSGAGAGSDSVANPGGAASGTPADTPTLPSVTAILFDRLSPKYARLRGARLSRTSRPCPSTRLRWRLPRGCGVEVISAVHEPARRAASGR